MRLESSVGFRFIVRPGFGLTVSKSWSCHYLTLNIVSCILHNSLIASALISLCPFWFSLTLATMYEHDTAAINCYNATLTTDGNFATGRASAGADR